LAAIGVILVGLLLFRGYGHRLAARPTEHHPAAVARQVDLNTADWVELMQIPGVGPHLADAILTHRRDRGRFAAVDELTGVKGIGGKTLDKLRPWVTVREPDDAEPTPHAVERLERKPTAKPAPSRSGKLKPGDPPLDVNAASEEDIQRLPGVGPTLARRIVETRGAQPFRTPDDLRRVKGIGPKSLENIRPFVVCR
jgi:competence protein ComEA